MTKLLAFFLILAFLLANPSLILAAQLRLAPVSGTYNKNCDLDLSIEIDTEGAEVAGTDVILQYDQSKFSFVSWTKGTFFPEYQPEDSSTTGVFSTSALSSVTTGIKGSGIIGSVKLRVKDTATTGATAVKFQFDPNDKSNTADSNVAEFSTTGELLTSVRDGNYIIGSGKSCAGGSGSTTGGGSSGGRGAPGSTDSGVLKTPFPTKVPLADTAITGPTLVLTAVGTILVVLGIIGLAII